MGQIRKRGDVYWIRYYRNGRRFEESADSADLQVAKDLLKVREGDIAKGIPVSSRIARLRFDEAADDLKAEYRVNNRRTLQDLEIRITLHLQPFFGGRRMSTITTADVRNYTLERLDEDAAHATVNRELAALKRMFILAIKANKLLVRPHIPMLKERNVRTGFLEHDQFEKVRAALPAELRPVVTFAYLTGWRIPSEVLTLQWRQVNLKAGTVRLDPGTTKNDEGRTFPFGQALPELRRVLKAQRALTDAVERAEDEICPWVFHRKGKRITDFRGAWTKACTAAGCPQLIPHDFRRTAVRNLERAGVSRSAAMKLTGHLTESVYRRYAIVSEGDLAAAIGKLGELVRASGRSRRGARGSGRGAGKYEKHETPGTISGTISPFRKRGTGKIA